MDHTSEAGSKYFLRDTLIKQMPIRYRLRQVLRHASGLYVLWVQAQQRRCEMRLLCLRGVWTPYMPTFDGTFFFFFGGTLCETLFFFSSASQYGFEGSSRRGSSWFKTPESACYISMCFICILFVLDLKFDETSDYVTVLFSATYCTAVC